MISSDLLQIIRESGAKQIARIVVARIAGSVPREAGAFMWVAQESINGTIGGGRLEYEAIAHARALLASPSQSQSWLREGKSWPLGPALGQCCGGMVDVLFELVSVADLEIFQRTINQADPSSLLVRSIDDQAPPVLINDRHALQGLPLSVTAKITEVLRGACPRKPELVGDFGNHAWFVEPLKSLAKPLFIYGAGHVGRAIVKTVEDLDFAISWVDMSEQRFPESLSPKISRLVAVDPQEIAALAPPGAFHLVLTYSHEIDFDLCKALLVNNRFGYLGLIGSKTKRARFVKRLGEGGIGQQALSQLTCPIGIGDIKDKQPASIAVSVAAQLQQKLEQDMLQYNSIDGSAYAKAR